MNWGHINCGLVTATLILVFIWGVFLYDKWETRRKKKEKKKRGPDGK